MADYMENVRAGFQFGQNRLENSRRMQELKSADSLRRLQERQIAQNLQLQMEQNNLQIQYRADMAKAGQMTMIETSPFLPAPGSPTGVVPNPRQIPLDQALLKNEGQVLRKYEPDKFQSFVGDVAMMPYRMAQAERMKAQADLINKGAASTPGETQVQEFEGFSVARTPEGKFHVIKQNGDRSFAPSEFEKKVSEYEKRTGKKLSDEKLTEYFEINIGAQPRAAVTKPLPTEAQYLDKHLPSVRREDAAGFVVRSDEEREKELRDQYKRLYGGEGEDQTQPATEEKVEMIHPDGRRVRVPKSFEEKALKSGYKRR